MKRALICALLGLLLLTGCAGKAVDPAVLGPALLEGAGFPEGMLTLESDMAGSVFQMDMTTVTACYAAVSGSAGADELVVLTAGNEDGAEAVYDLLSDRIACRQESFSDYNPAEAAKLREAILLREGTAVVYCVCPDPEAALKIIGR